MSNDINKLRDHLFATLEGLGNGTVDIERAKAVCEVAQVVVNTAKVEVDYLEATGGTGTGFVNSLGMSSSTAATETATPMGAVVRHYVKGLS